jgi:hypothetical protein
LVEAKTIVPKEEPIPPTVPMDYDWARVSIYEKKIPVTWCTTN